MLECLLLEILIKIQSTVHFLFTLNRKAHKISVKSQNSDVLISMCK